MKAKEPRKRVYTPSEVDEILSKSFKGAHSCLTLPGYLPVYGVIKEIALDPRNVAERVINIQFNNKDNIYTCSLECLHECLKVTKEVKVNGNNE